MVNMKEKLKGINYKVRRSNINLIGRPDGDYMGTEREALFEKIMAENIPELIKRH